MQHEIEIRQATPGDGHGVRKVVNDALAVYVDRIGRPPVPMEVDYDAAIRDRDFWVADDEGPSSGWPCSRPPTTIFR
ncbi:MAG TPA: hypothetical protein VGG09_03845 [Acidimicrobiales bacterium]|jgi:hypothetical protein